MQRPFYFSFLHRGDKVVASASLMMDPKVSEVAQLMAEKGTPSVSDLK